MTRIDTAIEPRTALRVDHLAADLTKIGWPMVRPFKVDAGGSVRSEAASFTTPAAGVCSIDGSATNGEARLKLSLTALPLETLAA